MTSLRRLATGGLATMVALAVTSLPAYAATKRAIPTPKPVAPVQVKSTLLPPQIYQVTPAKVNPTTQPNIACGPCIVAIMTGMVTNGPMPHICVMLIAVACTGPILRSSVGCRVIAAPDSSDLMDGELTRPPYFVRKLS